MSTLRANVSFNVGTLIVHRGDLVDSGSSIIKGREHLFDAVEVAVLSARALETASAAPGTRRRRGKAAAKPKAPAKPKTTPAPAVVPTPAVVPVDAGTQPASEDSEPVEPDAGTQGTPPADVDGDDQEPADDSDQDDAEDGDESDQDDVDDADQDDAGDDQLPADDAGVTPPAA